MRIRDHAQIKDSGVNKTIVSELKRERRVAAKKIKTIDAMLGKMGVGVVRRRRRKAKATAKVATKKAGGDVVNIRKALAPAARKAKATPADLRAKKREKAEALRKAGASAGEGEGRAESGNG